MVRTPIVAYTDGACKGNPGPGGWASILKFGEYEKELTGSAYHTTNNKMELTAVIETVCACKRPCAIHIVTDSTYVMSKKHKKNRDLWAKLDKAVKDGNHSLTFEHVYGHSGHRMNERCDRLASKAATDAYYDYTFEMNNEFELDIPEPW
jgi:ribonuclease HI